MKVSITARIVVDPGENFGPGLNLAVCQHFASKGFVVSYPHVYPEDPIIIECVEPIPLVKY